MQHVVISIHALLAESDGGKIHNPGQVLISIHALLAESDLLQRYCTDTTSISIHALLAESDTSRLHKIFCVWDFYPRSPCGERRMSTTPSRAPSYFYPRSPCGERRFAISAHCLDGGISIHALLAESDESQRPCARPTTYFYPRSPCGERPPITFRHCTTYLFLSTLSLRRATRSRKISTRPCPFLSTLSLRRATR